MTPTDSDATPPTGPAELTRELSDQFRSFVEWVLEIDLTEAQEERLHHILLEEWQENDEATIHLVQGSLTAYELAQFAEPDYLETWREENRKSFIASLRDNGEELGQSLLNAYASAHPFGAQLANASGHPRVEQPGPSWKSALGMFGAILGGVALAVLEERAERAQEARTKIREDHENSENAIKSLGDAQRDFQNYQNTMDSLNEQMRIMHETNMIASDIFGTNRWERRF